MYMGVRKTMSRKIEYGPGSGAVAIHEYELREQERKEEIDRRRWEKEMELKERELQMKSQDIAQFSSKLDRIEQTLSRIENMLSRFETQYFYPFTQINKDK